jgi:hypothetical protein
MPNSKHFLAFTSLLLASTYSLVANAQVNISHPGPGTPERIAILDGMRSTTQAELKIPEVQYAVKAINVANGWAYVAASAQRKDGKRINAKEVCAYEIHGDQCITNIESVLRNVNGAWKIDSYVGGATDVWQTEYCDKKGFPFEILGTKRSNMCPSGNGASVTPTKK